MCQPIAYDLRLYSERSKGHTFNVGKDVLGLNPFNSSFSGVVLEYKKEILLLFMGETFGRDSLKKKYILTLL